MLHMEISSQAQGGRYHVAIAAVVVLGIVDSQIARAVKRWAPLSLGVTRPERRYAAVSLVSWLGSAVILIGEAWLLP
jgi:hypothetical protein